MNDKNTQYFDYLAQRSRLGWLYRKFFLYPRLSRELTGDTLDIGCGIGDFLAFRAGTTGVDINPLLVEYCSKRGLNAKVMTADQLPFEAEQFDSIVLDNVLEHIVEPAALLNEIKRVLKPSGSLLIGVPGERGYASDPDHKIFYTEQQLEQLFIGLGWKTRKVFATPIRSKWLNERMRQYCIYAVFDNAIGRH